MENGNEKMKVWMVAGYMNYEGDCLDLSGKVFLNRENAEKYGQSLLKVGFDGYSLKEVEVN